jgi:hypothetical protein
MPAAEESTTMWDKIIVGVVVAAAVCLAVKSLVKSLSGNPSEGCGCASSAPSCGCGLDPSCHIRQKDAPQKKRPH